MREDPNPDKPAHEKFFAGDNFVRNGGEYSAWQSLTVHSHSAHEKGLDVHMQANPSLAELLHKQFREKKDKMQVRVCARLCVCGRGGGYTAKHACMHTGGCVHHADSAAIIKTRQFECEPLCVAMLPGVFAASKALHARLLPCPCPCLPSRCMHARRRPPR